MKIIDASQVTKFEIYLVILTLYNRLSMKPKFYRDENGKLGEGGYGQVFSGTMKIGRQSYRAAFKKLILGYSKDYDRESRIKDLDHLFVVKFYGSHREETVE